MTTPKRNVFRDVVGAIAVGIISVVLFVVLMRSVVILGKHSGESVREHLSAPDK